MKEELPPSPERVDIELTEEQFLRLTLAGKTAPYGAYEVYLVAGNTDGGYTDGRDVAKIVMIKREVK